MDEMLMGCASAAAAGGLACALMNPLDTLKVRFQVDGAASSTRRFAARIVRAEGLWKGLYAPGLGANALAIGVSSAGRVGLYPYARDAVVEATGGERSAPAMFAAGLGAGAAGYLASAPVFQVKTLAQAEAGAVGGDGILTSGASAGSRKKYASLASGLARLSRERALWRGAGTLTVRGAFLSAGMQLGYDGCKTAARERRLLEDGPALHVLAACSGALGAALCSTPIDVVMVAYQRADAATYRTPLHCGAALARSGGPAIFYRGFTPIILRLVPVFLLSMPLTEQIRRVMGLGYI